MTAIGPDLEEITSLLEQVDGEAFAGDKAARLQAIDAAKRMITRLQTPFEISQVAFHILSVRAAVHTLMDLGIWQAWYKAGGGERSISEIVEMGKVNCDPVLIRRLLRLLAADYILDEVDEDVWRSTSYSLALGDIESGIPGAFLSTQYHNASVTRHLPDYLAKIGYRNPVVPHEVYIDSFPEKLNFWERNASNPAYNDAFNRAMRRMTMHKQPWTEIFDVQSLVDGPDWINGSPLLVDIGGGDGHDISLVLEKLPDVPSGSLVLQDQPHVIAATKVNKKIKVMSHDFLTPEPIKGSRAYFMHSVLHDWNDEDCLRILDNLRPALKRGYSKLLLCDIALPPTGASIEQAAMDVVMMMMYSAQERTENAWRKLLDQAGFRIVKVWSDNVLGNEAVIEAELK